MVTVETQTESPACRVGWESGRLRQPAPKMVCRAKDRPLGYVARPRTVFGFAEQCSGRGYVARPRGIFGRPGVF